jgi:hypothetical protein
MSENELRSLLRNIAIIAAGINHAVDAQKTYHLDFLEECAEDIVTRYSFKPYNERFKNASPLRPNNHPEWDRLTASKGEGSVDTLGDVIAGNVASELLLDTSSLTFDWRMLRHPEERFNKQIGKAVVDEHLAKSIQMLGRTNNEQDLRIINKMVAGERVGYADVLPLIKYLNSIFFSEYQAREDDTKSLVSANAYRIQLLRKIIVDFVRAGTQHAAEMTDDEVLMLAATSALRMAYTANKHTNMRRFIFDVFGDMYAEAAMLNIAANYQSELNREPEYEFDPDAYSVPPVETEMLDSFFFNEMNDIG